MRRRQPRRSDHHTAKRDPVTGPERLAAGIEELTDLRPVTPPEITKLKLVKRQMYGRAHLDLLRARLLVSV